MRGLLAAATLFVGYSVVTRSLAEAVQRADPARAHVLAPSDGRITASLAEKRFLENPVGNPQSPASRLAQRALRQDPTALPAVATLGFQAQLRGDTGEARRLFGYAQKLSRRDLQTQLWAVEDAVGRGDIPGALRHYDIALRTSQTAPDLMFPVLAAAIPDPAIRSSLVATLAKKPAWAPKFVGYLAANGADPQAMARLFAAMRKVGVPVSTEADAAAVAGLLSKNAVDDAWRYYASVRSGAARQRSRDPRFTASLTTPAVFDWNVSTDPNLAASIQRGARGGIVDFAASPSAGGALLRQVQFLPPGSYRLAGHSSDIDQPAQSRPYWTLTCLDGRELGRIEVPNSNAANGGFAGRFSVPAGCAVQTLTLIARPSDDIAGVSGQIDRAQLIPDDRGS